MLVGNSFVSNMEYHQKEFLPHSKITNNHTIPYFSKLQEAKLYPEQFTLILNQQYLMKLKQEGLETYSTHLNSFLVNRMQLAIFSEDIKQKEEGII